MAWTFSENSQSVGTTEHDLVRDAAFDSGQLQTANVSVQVWLDINNIARGDVFELALYEKVMSSGTVRRTVLCPQLPIDTIFVTPALLVGNGWAVTLTKISGTDRTIEWSVRQIPEA